MFRCVTLQYFFPLSYSLINEAYHTISSRTFTRTKAGKFSKKKSNFRFWCYPTQFFVRSLLIQKFGGFGGFAISDDFSQ